MGCNKCGGTNKIQVLVGDYSTLLTGDYSKRKIVLRDCECSGGLSERDQVGYALPDDEFLNENLTNVNAKIKYYWECPQCYRHQEFRANSDTKDKFSFIHICKDCTKKYKIIFNREETDL